MLKKAEKPENVQPAAKRKLTRAERKQIEAIIRQAMGDGEPHTVQDSIPFRNMYPDGLCRLDDRLFSKTIAYEDVNYRLAGPDDQRDIFERLCDFYNGYDPSIGVQMTLSSRHEDKNGNLFGMDAQGDALDDMRVEASGILQIQYERGNNGFVKRKYFSRFVVGLSAFWQETLYFGKFFRNTENSNTKKENARTIQNGKCGHFLFVRSCLELD